MKKVLSTAIALGMLLSVPTYSTYAFNDSEMQTEIWLSDELAKAQAEIRNLKAENESLKNKAENLFLECQEYIRLMNSDINFILDSNKDGVVDANDASFTLTYYALASTGHKYYTYNELYYKFMVKTKKVR